MVDKAVCTTALPKYKLEKGKTKGEIIYIFDHLEGLVMFPELPTNNKVSISASSRKNDLLYLCSLVLVGYDWPVVIVSFEN